MRIKSMTVKYAAIIAMTCLLANGCALLGPAKENEGDIIQDLTGWGRSGTILILNSTFHDNSVREKKAVQFKKIVEDNVLPWLNDDSKQINGQVFNALLGTFSDGISADYRAVAEDSFNQLSRRVPIPTAGKVLSKVMVVRLKAFFDGSLVGCDLVIKSAQSNVKGGG